MASTDYFEAAASAARTSVLIEEVARERLANILLDYRDGYINPRAIRFRVAGVIRAAYKASEELAAQFANEHVGSGLGKFKKTVTSDYLKNLILDANAALREFHATDRSDTEWNGIARRLGLSTGNAAIRGYGDGLLAAGRAAELSGNVMRKRWITETESNVCPFCAALDGKEVGVMVGFGFPTLYGNDLSPPRHPNCRCSLILVPAS